MVGNVKAMKCSPDKYRKFIKLHISTYSLFSLNQATKGVQTATFFSYYSDFLKNNCLSQTESYFLYDQ